jgi:hypothetical protein
VAATPDRASAPPTSLGLAVAQAAGAGAGNAPCAASICFQNAGTPTLASLADRAVFDFGGAGGSAQLRVDVRDASPAIIIHHAAWAHARCHVRCAACESTRGALLPAARRQKCAL